MSKIYDDTVYGYIDRSLPSSKTYSPQLISNTTESTMSHAITSLLGSCQSFVFSVAFVTSDGLGMLMEALNAFQGRGTIITSTYLGFNEPDVLLELLKFDNIDVYLADEKRGFHAKGYIFRHDIGVTAIVGSSNLTANALKVNSEWNLRFSSERDGDVADQLDQAVEAQIAHAQPLTPQLIDDYAARRRKRLNVVDDDQPLEIADGTHTIIPNAMQANALEALDQLYATGEKRGLIISATGTGKTILAALAVRNYSPKRFLFIVHREQILKKAVSEFQKVLRAPDSDFGLFAGSKQQVNARYVFATIQSLSRGENRQMFARSAFDYIIIDEAHRVGAGTYQKIINYFTPGFLLGLSATPERTDGFNVFEVFDYNVPYEIRLREALSAKMLAPFHYYGITDYSDLHALSGLEELTSDVRIDYIVSKLEAYGRPRGVRGLIFCSRVEEAALLSAKLNERFVSGRQLRTLDVSGESSTTDREEAVRDLEAGLFDYLITVDIFNEGIDIPSINQVVLLRRTKSAIIFTQQLGRGLRKAVGKSHVRVIDFIANYDTNYLIPLALSGDKSGRKESLRRSVEDLSVAGASSVSFDEISREKILQSIEQADLNADRLAADAIRVLRERFNRTPRLHEFARFDLCDPEVIACGKGKKGNRDYWTRLRKLEIVKNGPSEVERSLLEFLSVEFLSAARPHELLVLSWLLASENHSISVSALRERFEEAGVLADSVTVASVIHVLTLAFYRDKNFEKKFGNIELAELDGDCLRLSPSFLAYYSAYPAEYVDGDAIRVDSMRVQVDDLIHAGLDRCRARGTWRGALVVGETYRSRDVCRLIGWDRNMESVVNGYILRQGSQTCPLFVTYNKGRDEDIATAYEDQFLSPASFIWYTKHGKTLENDLERRIVQGQLDLPLFVRRSKSSTEFTYLGRIYPVDHVEERKKISDTKDSPILKVVFELESAVEESLYSYITAPSVHASSST